MKTISASSDAKEAPPAHLMQPSQVTSHGLSEAAAGGAYSPRKSALERLAEALGVPADELRECAISIRNERLNAKNPGSCQHDWRMSWPLDPVEYTCEKCGEKTLK